jgi:hypothetical protein
MGNKLKFNKFENFKDSKTHGLKQHSWTYDQGKSSAFLGTTKEKVYLP